MNNPETLATPVTQDTGRRQTKQKTKHRKLKKMSNTTPLKQCVNKGSPGEWTIMCGCATPGEWTIMCGCATPGEWVIMYMWVRSIDVSFVSTIYHSVVFCFNIKDNFWFGDLILNFYLIAIHMIVHSPGVAQPHMIVHSPSMAQPHMIAHSPGVAQPHMIAQIWRPDS
jgi:hypothetical protein